MSIGLDLGVHELRSLRRGGDGVVGRKTRAAYAVLPDTEARRRMLGKLDIPHAVCEGSLLLVGDVAVEFASTFQTPLLPLLPDSRIPTNDAPARQVLAALVDSLLPKPTEPSPLCCLTLPGLLDRDERAGELLLRVVELKGYQPLIVGRGLAVVLSELVRDSFTGIGIDFGAGTTDVSIVHRGIEIDRHTVRIGGDWLDHRIAREFGEHAWDARGNRFLDTESVRIRREANASLLEPTDPRGEFLGEVHTQLFGTILSETAEVWARNPALAGLPSPLPVVCAGGLTGAVGFEALFRAVWRRTDFPVEPASVRVVPDCRYTIARGCLINAELESETRRRNDAA